MCWCASLLSLPRIRNNTIERNLKVIRNEAENDLSRSDNGAARTLFVSHPVSGIGQGDGAGEGEKAGDCSEGVAVREGEVFFSSSSSSSALSPDWQQSVQLTSIGTQMSRKVMGAELYRCADEQLSLRGSELRNSLREKYVFLEHPYQQITHDSPLIIKNRRTNALLEFIPVAGALIKSASVHVCHKPQQKCRTRPLGSPIAGCTAQRTPPHRGLRARQRTATE